MFRFLIVPLSSVVDLPESSRGDPMNENNAFRALSQSIMLLEKLSGRFVRQQHLTGGPPGF
jgi:hypothetical protein